ncbi:hypothetical protein [Streptomyces sp. NPDC020965]
MSDSLRHPAEHGEPASDSPWPSPPAALTALDAQTFTPEPS